MKKVEDYIKTIPDYPQPGIMFRDITTILSDKDGFKLAVDILVEALKDVDFDLVLGSESRGFIFGAPVAYAMNKGFILVRKKGKLPRETISQDYDLEYGKNTLEICKGSLKKGDNVLLLDDLLATGGTVNAAIKLVERLGAKVVGCAFLIELVDLKGRENIGPNYPILALLEYEGE